MDICRSRYLGEKLRVLLGVIWRSLDAKLAVYNHDKLWDGRTHRLMLWTNCSLVPMARSVALEQTVWWLERTVQCYWADHLWSTLHKLHGFNLFGLVLTPINPSQIALNSRFSSYIWGHSKGPKAYFNLCKLPQTIGVYFTVHVSKSLLVRFS